MCLRNAKFSLRHLRFVLELFTSVGPRSTAVQNQYRDQTGQFCRPMPDFGQCQFQLKVYPGNINRGRTMEHTQL